MRLPMMRWTPRDGASKTGGLALPAVIHSVRSLAPGTLSRILKISLDVAYIVLALLTGLFLLVLIVSIFIPMDNLDVSVTDDNGGHRQQLTRALLVFVLGAITAYFAGFMLILRSLRRIFATLTMGDPFHPANIRRLRQIGMTLAVVTGGVWLAQSYVATRLAPGVLEAQGLSDLLTPIFSVLIVFVLAEVFREGARLRRESELTI